MLINTLVLLLSLYWIAETTAFLHASEVAFLGVRDEAADLKLDGYHRRRQISTHQYAQPVTKPDDSIIDQGTGVTRFQLLSLQYTPVESGTSVGLVPRFSKAAADAWRWKDAVLGDGRDFFVPRPKTLQKLGSYLQEEIPEIQECIILSNCARFEILVALDGSLDSNDLSLAISRRVIAQAEYYQKKVDPATKMMVSSMDWPRVVAGSSDLRTLGKDSEQTAEELQSLWTHMTELTEIMNHLAQVAVGLALRPRRPDRPVQFRPFSSRDAHILLQLKRTVEAFSSSPSPSPQLAQLLKFALQAGKAARDTQKVPELSALLLYGSGDSQKYSTQPPPELLQNVTDAVMTTVIEPIIKECASNFLAQSRADVISAFRLQCESLATNGEELQWIRRELHIPTMELRQGRDSSNLDVFVHDLNDKLETKRKHNAGESVLCTTE